ncbi:F-box protein At1g47056-like [Impatiens glandulifera]|uniref:F-box protein At1g47056-like n=1 Tax=Impatiens glandulifera TaxID=253017 RepID=UPI001FB0B084|nr:F-box protein At1g47056-like [Impatiens glandulifera]
MGQASSSLSTDGNQINTFNYRSTMSNRMEKGTSSEEECMEDFISNIPDECLASIFESLGSGDRIRCSLVCTRWLRIEGQSRHRLSLNAQADLLSMIPKMFSRFDSITKLALRCDRRSVSIGDETLVLISLRCRNLTRLKLRGCRELTDSGMAALSMNCKNLKKLSCGSCTFGAKGMNAVLENCSSLEELSVKRLRGLNGGALVEPIVPGVAGLSLKTLCLKELSDGLSFGPLIIGAVNLKTLKLFRCSGEWDKVFKLIPNQVTTITEIHLEKLQVSDVGLIALSNCPKLEFLHLVKTPECTNVGLSAIAENCKLLRKLHIDGWKMNRIRDDGLIAVAKHCPNLQELVLVGVNPTRLSLEPLATNCKNLERLALCGSESVGDPEISCIAEKCIALKKLCIKNCPVSDLGLEALAGGCPNLVKVKVKKCKLVTSKGVDGLRASRGSLTINLDIDDPEQAHQVASTSRNGGGENNVGRATVFTGQAGDANIASSSNGRASSFKVRFGFTKGSGLVACTLRRWSSFSSRNNNT